MPSPGFRTSRRCPRCGDVFAENRNNFYYRPSSGRYGYCLANDCHRLYHEEYRARRANADGSGSTGRRFGVEIEFTTASRETVAREMRRLGLTCTVSGYTHRVTRSWKIVTDGSVDGYELVSPPLRGEAGMRAIRKACEALHAAGAGVDSTCGLHVHHEVRDLNMRSLAKLMRQWRHSQGAIDKLVAKSRRNRGRRSNWCMRLLEADITRVERAPAEATYADINGSLRSVFYRHERYRALNVGVYPRAGTVEVRQHQGTVNADKIIAWVELGQAMIQWSTTDQDPAPARSSSLPTFLTTMKTHGGLSEETAGFLAARAAVLATPRGQRNPVIPETDATAYTPVPDVPTTRIAPGIQITFVDDIASRPSESRGRAIHTYADLEYALRPGSLVRA